MLDFFEDDAARAAGAPDAETPLSVTEFTRRVRALVENAFGDVRVRGEVSNLRIQSSGHAYFTLKDAGAQLSAVAFRGTLARSGTRLREGMQIVVSGKISVYEPRGNYQIVVRAFQEEGLGRLQEAFERLRRKLEAEGLFDKSLKRAIPPLSRTIAFVTSPTGAAIRDFISILRRRGWRGRLIVVPAKVQGVGAAEEIARGIKSANAVRGLDLLVVGRGGGSLEDLWCFNEEIVARAVRASRVPVISAVGHEIDFTLSDFAADLRAETPSAAAEYISSARMEMTDRVDAASAQLENLTDRAIQDFFQHVDLLESKLARNSPQNRLHLARERLSGTASRLAAASAGRLSRLRETLSAAAFSLERQNPEHRVKLARLRLEQLATRLSASGLDATLRRGFAVARDAKTGKIIGRSRDVGFGQLVELQFADGRTRVEGRDLS